VLYFVVEDLYYDFIPFSFGEPLAFKMLPLCYDMLEVVFKTSLLD